MGAWVIERTGDGAADVRASAGPLPARLAADGAVRDIAKGEPSFAEPWFLGTLESGQPQFINDFSTLPERRTRQAAALGVEAFAVLPLLVRRRTVATLCLASDTAGIFDESLCPLLVGGAQSISQALDRFQSKADLDRARAHTTELLRRLVGAQEHERARIAADVHDEPVQALAAVDLRLALLERQLADTAPQLVPDVVLIHGIVASVNDGLRDLLFELEPIRESALLTDLLEEAAAHILELTPVVWKIENAADPRELELSVATRTQAVRIAKEALANVAKHAHAQTVGIRVTVDDEGVTVKMVDDGVGLPPGPRTSAPGHRGIRGMLDRAEIAGGSLSVFSDGPGTSVSVWLPRDWHPVRVQGP